MIIENSERFLHSIPMNKTMYNIFYHQAGNPFNDQLQGAYELSDSILRLH